MQQVIQALKALLPVLEPILAKEVDQLLDQAQAALDGKISSPDLKLAEQCLMAAVKKFVDFEMAKLAPQA